MEFQTTQVEFLIAEKHFPNKNYSQQVEKPKNSHPAHLLMMAANLKKTFQLNNHHNSTKGKIGRSATVARPRNMWMVFLSVLFVVRRSIWWLKSPHQHQPLVKPNRFLRHL